MNKVKSTLIKVLTAVSMAVIGLVTLNTTNNQAQAATPSVVTINYVPGYSIAVWNSPSAPHMTGQLLKHNSSWQVIKTAYVNGETWYDLGLNQWIEAKYTVAGQQNLVKPAVPASQAPVSTVSGSEAAAKAWIANRESGGNYNARNGIYIGKYQLTSSYLHGDYSPANQERTADAYVKGRYGSWVNAKNFWVSHGWY